MECMHAHKGGIAVVGFSLNCQRMLTAGPDSHVVVWDVATRKQLHTFQEHESECLGTSPVPDCSRASLLQNCSPARAALRPSQHAGMPSSSPARAPAEDVLTAVVIQQAAAQAVACPPAGSTVNDACWRDNDVLAFSSSDHVHVCSFQKRKYLKQFGHSGGETYLGWSQDCKQSMHRICPGLQLHPQLASWQHCPA